MSRLTENDDALEFLESEELGNLEPWEISEIVKHSLHGLPKNVEEHTEIIFDIVYGAISEALGKVRGFG